MTSQEEGHPPEAGAAKGDPRDLSPRCPDPRDCPALP